MARGGKRANAGRKAGAVTVRTRENVEKALASGIAPLDVMLDNMRFFHEAAAVALKRLLAGSATPKDIIGEHDPKAKFDEENPPNTVEAVALILKLRDRAGEAARDAAPFCHARISPVDARKKPNEDTEVPLVERLKRYATADAIKASGGKVVVLDPKPAPSGRAKAQATRQGSKGK